MGYTIISGGRGYNLITGNYCGVGCGYESHAVLGTTSAYGYNSIYDNTYCQVAADYDSHVLAENNWWNREPPTYPDYYYAGDFCTSSGGTIDYDPALEEDPLGGLLKTSPGGERQEIAAVTATEPFFDPELIDALDDLLKGKYEEAMTKYVERFKKETDKSKKRYVLRRIAECYKLSGKNGFVDFLNNEVRNTELSKKDELYATSVMLENMLLIREKKYEQAVNNFETLVNDFSDNGSILKPALFNLVCLNYNQLNSAVKGKEYLAELKSLYPEDDLTLQAMLMAGEINNISLPLPKAKEEVVVKEENLNTYELFENYPNPFNPSTTISYSLPEAGNVQIKIFDVLGREVTKLVDEIKNAGKHTVAWNGSNYSSGIYFYKITFNNQTMYKKMLLLK